MKYKGFLSALIILGGGGDFKYKCHRTLHPLHEYIKRLHHFHTTKQNHK